MATMMFAAEGSVLIPASGNPPDDDFTVVQVRAGCSFPRLFKDFLVAEEGSLINPPDTPIIYIKKGAPFPVLVEV